jgi:hypothetical protein
VNGCVYPIYTWCIIYIPPPSNKDYDGFTEGVFLNVIETNFFGLEISVYIATDESEWWLGFVYIISLLSLKVTLFFSYYTFFYFCKYIFRNAFKRRKT